MRKSISVAALSVLLTQSLVSAGELNLGDTLSKYPITGLDQAATLELDRLLKKHSGSYVRPKARPLQSNGHKDILNKIEAIRGLFKDPSCLDDPTALDKIMNGAATLKEELDKAAEDSGVDQLNTSQLSEIKVGETTVDGESITKVVDGLNNILFKNKCKLNKGRVLERGADIIQNFAQLGLLVPNANGLIVAGGGLALSSLLRVIDNLFKAKFDFDKNEDRLNFIKLNCAFYDIRREIENSGMVDIALQSHYRDKKVVDGLIKSISDKIKAIETNQAKIVEAIDKRMKELVEADLAELVTFEKVLEATLPALEKPVTTEDEKFAAILAIAQNLQGIKSGFDAYKSRELGRIRLFDMDFARTLVEALDVNTLMTLTPEKFNADFRARMLFHLKRAKSDVNAARQAFTAKNLKATTIEGKSVAEFKKALEKSAASGTLELKKKNSALEGIQGRLKRIVDADRGYTMNDDGTENKVAILSSYDDIAEQVYGRWGYKFLKYTTRKANDINGDFEYKFKQFAADHLNNEDGTFSVPNPADRGDMRVLYACQDAKRPRQEWVLADSLTQQAFDFVATNKELFHSDIERVFLGNTGERSGIHSLKSKYEKIQWHHKTSIYANKVLKGEDVDPKNKEKYLSGYAKRMKYLGPIMLEVNNSKQKAGLIQELVEKYKCNRLTSQD